MQYTGEDYLNALEIADNYNDFIAGLFASRIGDAGRIVDFGAGTGLLARKVHEKTGKDVQCLEPAENMKKYLPGVVLDSLDEVADGSIDFIYSSNVLEHIEDDAAVIAEMARVLKPAGRVCLYLPACQCLFSQLDRRVGHYRRYDKARLKVLFNPKQWKMLDLRYADSLGFAATLYFKLFGNRAGDFHIPSLKFYDRAVFPVSRLIDWLTFGFCPGKNVFVCAEKCCGE
jgi:SAM-dependent methyltransferase